MVWLAMQGARWTGYGLQFSSFMFFILVSEIHGHCSLNSEGLTLLQFREKVKLDPSGALANWNPNDCDPCMWSGIECLDDKVIMLNLSGHYLEGVLAPELGNLTHLRYINISKNHLSGTIPPHFGQLTTLEVLDLRDNNLSGTVPAELGGLHSLKLLLLCNNKFEGNIPIEIGKLSDLQFDYVLSTAAAAEICCINRKLGHSLKLGSESAQDYSDNGCRNLTDIPELDVGNSNKHMPSVRRVLVEQSVNLAALPPDDFLALNSSETVVMIPSRSSGSFPASPNKRTPAPAPAPVSSPTLDQENKPHGTTDQPGNKETSDGNSGNSLQLIIDLSIAVFVLIVAAVIFFIFRSKAARSIGPWRTGLSGQLQKAFVTGVPKLNREELETACEDFSNIIYTQEGAGTLYKGTLSSGVEIAVASTVISYANKWPERAELIYRKKIDTLSRVNHKNFVNLIGYCEEDEPFTRMMVFEYAPNGSLFEHLHVKEAEHLDWDARMRIIMGAAYCLQHMHELNPPVAHVHLTSKEIFLTDDYAAKIGDIEFWEEMASESKNLAEGGLEHSELPPLADVETNIHSFGIMMLEVISGRLPHSEEHGDILTWAETYLGDTSSISQLIDPILESFKDNELEVVCEAIRSCTQQDPRQRPLMDEVIKKLRQAVEISANAATPRLSPLWWAELEILSAEAP